MLVFVCIAILLSYANTLAPMDQLTEEQRKQDDHAMMVIKKWDDVRAFKNKIVVYRAQGYRLTGKKYGYVIKNKANHSGNQLRIGYISGPPQERENSGHGYTLHMLFKSVHCALTRLLTTHEIEQDNGKREILMRKATQQERHIIFQALTDHDAHFAHMLLHRHKIERFLRRDEEKVRASRKKESKSKQECLPSLPLR